MLECSHGKPLTPRPTTPETPTSKGRTLRHAARGEALLDHGNCMELHGTSSAQLSADELSEVIVINMAELDYLFKNSVY